LERDLDNGAPLRSLRFSADGRRLIALLDEGLSSRAWLWYLESGASIPLQGIAGLRVAHAAFSPDGDSIATVSSDMVVRLWSARDARLLRSFKGGLFQPMEIAWNADGSRLVMRANDARLQVWYANERPDVFELRGSGGALNAARFSPDGERVLTACEDGQARVWTAPSRLLTAEDEQPARAHLVGDHAGHPSAHRLPAHDHVPATAMLLDHAPERVEQHRLPIRRAATLPRRPPRRHVRKLKARDADVAVGQRAGEPCHEG
jgi:WD40 repeat protein